MVAFRWVGLLGLLATVPASASEDFYEPMRTHLQGRATPIASRTQVMTDLERKDLDWLHQLADGPPHLPETTALPPVDLSGIDLPVVWSEDVELWVVLFTTTLKQPFARWAGRLESHRENLEFALDGHGLPRSLSYLALVESGMLPEATSTIGAAGLWQIMPQTAPLLDLRIDWWIDERRDPELSTFAALGLLAELHERFGDWSLAMAAYNAGPLPIEEAIARGGTRDFEQLVLHGLVAPEPRHFVAKVMAAAIVMENAKAFNLEPVSTPTVETTRVQVSGKFELEVLSACAGWTPHQFQRANPAVGRWGTPNQGYAVRVPRLQKKSFLRCLKGVSPAARVTYRRDHVVAEDSLDSIAARLQCSKEQMLSANDLRSDQALEIGQVLGCPGAHP
jgi:membrane-bound lytic murein transglycosylase D